MGLQCGIVGLPNVGKSTLFNALTAAKALAANYPFATKEPNIGVITVPDIRLQALADIVNPKKIIPTTVDIVDIAGLIKGASKGDGLGNQFLANIREVDAILHVVRCFEDDNVVHVDGSVDPVRDKEIIDTELILKDIETVEKRLERLRKQAKTGKKEDMQRVALTEDIMNHLEQGLPARSLHPDNPEEQEILKQMYLLSSKPVIYVCNVDEMSAAEGNAHTQNFIKAIEDENPQVLLISAGIESEIIDLETDEEKLEFLSEMGLTEPGVNRLIKASYDLLDLITYFTAGEKEVRAWTVRSGFNSS